MWQDTVEVLTYPMITERGKQVPDYTATPTAVSVTSVDVQPGSSTELPVGERTGSSVRWSVFMRGAPALTDKSIVRYLGRVYQVDGEPDTWAGTLAYRVARLVDWK